MKPCLITNTIAGLPGVDRLDEGLFVAAGGNGHAAKSADAIGALAAGLVETGRWQDTELERSVFAAAYGEFEARPALVTGREAGGDGATRRRCRSSPGTR